MIRDLVAWYRQRGWQTIRWPPLVKGTKMAWGAIDFPPEVFAEGDNIGIKLGDYSDGLIDIDLDCPEATILAPQFLPPTWTFGRNGPMKVTATVPGVEPIYPRHYLYRCPGLQTRKPGGHIELRSTGLQTIFPGSVHETGEPIGWASAPAPDPTHIDPQTLLRAFTALLIATTIARAWPSMTGNRHDLVLAFAGALWHSGWPHELARRVILAGTDFDGTSHPQREQGIDDTYSDTARNRYGWPTVERMIGTKEAQACQRTATDPELGFVNPSIAPAGGYPLNESGNADRLIDRYGDDLRHTHGIGWLRWDATRWVVSPGGPWVECELVARDIVAEAAGLPSAEAKPLADWGRSSGNASKIRGTLEIASNRARVRVEPDQLDADPWLLNTSSGTLDLRTGQLATHDRELLCTKQIRAEYDPIATCPRFQQFLWECMGGDGELVSYLIRFLGYSLTAHVSEHVLAIWHGPQGANGKSTLISVITWLLGDYAGTTAPEVLLRSGASQHPTGLMDFRGRRLMCANEAPEARAWNESLVKQLTGGDTIKARAMRQDFVAFNPTWKIVLAANARPLVREQGGSFWRRVHLVPWLISFKGRENRNLENELKAEAPGILNLLVSGCLVWQRVGLAPPQSVLAAVEEYRQSQDTIGTFIAECIDRTDPVAAVARGEIYNAYRNWATLGGEHVLPRSAFFRVLEERGMRFDTGHGGKVVRGWKLKSATF